MKKEKVNYIDLKKLSSGKKYSELPKKEQLIIAQKIVDMLKKGSSDMLEKSKRDKKKG